MLKLNETFENHLLSHFIAYLNLTQTVLDHITQYVRRVFCEFVILRVVSEKEVRTTQPGKILPFEIQSEQDKEMLVLMPEKNRKRKMGMVYDDHDYDDALMTLTTIYLMMAIVLYQV